MGNSRVSDLEPVTSPPRRDLDYYDLQLSEEPVGEGGQTVVYKAHVPDSEPPETVAVRQSGDRGFEKSVKREELLPFVQKAETWASLAHEERTEPRWSGSDHIVGVVAVGENLPWAALEYMDGGSLSHRLEGTDGLPIKEAVWIVERLCQGIQVAHNTGVAHLDLKPGNILFRKTEAGTWDVPKIADWGLARNLLDDTSDSMEVLSTRYAAPEQLDRKEFGRPGTATDIYQLGAVLYALLAGTPPYTGAERSVMFDIVSDKTPAPSKRRSEVSEKLDAVVRTALEPRKSDRYGSVETFKQALEAIRAGDRLPPVVAQRASAKEPLTHSHTGMGPSGGLVDTTESDSVTRWAMFGFGSARRAKIDTYHGNNMTVTPKWQFDVSSCIHSSPAVVDDTLYINNMGSLHAIDTTTGTKQWTYYTSRQGEKFGGIDNPKMLNVPEFDYISSSPTVVGNTVYVGGPGQIGDGGWLCAVDTTTKTEQWRFETSGPVASSPAVVDGAVYVGSDDNKLYAIDAVTGRMQWQFETSGPIVSSPAVVDETVYVGSDDGNLYAVNTDTGKKQWQFSTSGKVRSSPAVANNTVYVGSCDHRLWAINTTNGSERWQFSTSAPVLSSPAITSNTVYIGSDDGNLYAVNATSGRRQWAFETSGKVQSSPVLTNDSVHVGSHDNKLYTVDINTGKKRGRAEVHDYITTSPAVVENMIYFANGSSSSGGRVYALEVS